MESKLEGFLKRYSRNSSLSSIAASPGLANQTMSGFRERKKKKDRKFKEGINFAKNADGRRQRMLNRGAEVRAREAIKRRSSTPQSFDPNGEEDEKKSGNTAADPFRAALQRARSAVFRAENEDATEETINNISGFLQQWCGEAAPHSEEGVAALFVLEALSALRPVSAAAFSDWLTPWWSTLSGPGDLETRVLSSILCSYGNMLASATVRDQGCVQVTGDLINLFVTCLCWQPSDDTAAAETPVSTAASLNEPGAGEFGTALASDFFSGGDSGAFASSGASSPVGEKDRITSGWALSNVLRIEGVAENVDAEKHVQPVMELFLSEDEGPLFIEVAWTLCALLKSCHVSLLEGILGSDPFFPRLFECVVGASAPMLKIPLLRIVDIVHTRAPNAIDWTSPAGCSFIEHLRDCMADRDGESRGTRTEAVCLVSTLASHEAAASAIMGLEAHRALMLVLEHDSLNLRVYAAHSLFALAMREDSYFSEIVCEELASNLVDLLSFPDMDVCSFVLHFTHTIISTIPDYAAVFEECGIIDHLDDIRIHCSDDHVLDLADQVMTQLDDDDGEYVAEDPYANDEIPQHRLEAQRRSGFM